MPQLRSFCLILKLEAADGSGDGTLPVQETTQRPAYLSPGTRVGSDRSDFRMIFPNVLRLRFSIRKLLQVAHSFMSRFFNALKFLKAKRIARGFVDLVADQILQGGPDASLSWCPSGIAILPGLS
jgi:hypothetical protein